MSEFKIKNFNSTVPRDTEFFRVLTERTLEKIPNFKPMLNPSSEDYHVFIALVQKLSYVYVNFPDKSHIVHRWIPYYYKHESSFGLTVAVRMVLDGKPEAFFEAGDLDKEVADTLIEIIQQTFTEVYVTNPLQLICSVSNYEVKSEESEVTL